MAQRITSLFCLVAAAVLVDAVVRRLRELRWRMPLADRPARGGGWRTGCQQLRRGHGACCGLLGYGAALATDDSAAVSHARGSDGNTAAVTSTNLK